MRHLVQEKQRATTLRKQGLSYNEILKEVKVAKSTLSIWLKDLPLTQRELNYLKTRTDGNISRGRIKAASENRMHRIERERLQYKEAAEVFFARRTDDIFLLGVALYWAEGSNKTPLFYFVNSDPAMVLFMYNWISKYLIVPKNDIGVRIYMHKVYSQSECEEYWCALLGRETSTLKKTIFKPTADLVRRNVNYKGCVRLDVGGVDKYRSVMAWKKCLKDYILREAKK